MARYVIAHRRAGLFTESEKLASRAVLASAIDILPISDIVEDHKSDDPLGRRTLLVEMDPTQLDAKRLEVGPSVIIEPEMFYWREAVPPIDKIGVADARGAQRADAVLASTVILTITGSGAPLRGAKVDLFTANNLGGGMKLTSTTDAGGSCRFSVPSGHRASAALVVPEGGFWVMIARGEQLRSPIDCPPLPMNGPQSWWHQVLGGGGTGEAGAGIRVGVADTGLWDHPALAHANLVNAFIDGDQLPAAQSKEVDSHGTHVAGIIGARPQQLGEYAGLAPNCDLFCSRIFRDSDSGASNADIANAIDSLSRDHRVDLINLSLGGDGHSELVADAVTDALERGTLCIVAAGNSNNDVRFPARLPNVVAVSALGLEGQYPDGSLSGNRLPTSHDRFGQDGLFAANFTCFGVGIDTTAPGVGIIAPVPNRISTVPHYGVMDGTSMASPAACGALAALLSADAEYAVLPRDVNRAIHARNVLAIHCRSVGLPIVVEGRGMLS